MKKKEKINDHLFNVYISFKFYFSGTNFSFIVKRIYLLVVRDLKLVIVLNVII